MPALPCAKHPGEMTLVRCGRCDTPICVQCMVDTPVGKKCRACARNQTHLTESTPADVSRAFLAALAVAVTAGWVIQNLGMLILILAVPYGYVVAEATMRAGKRRRSTAMQVAAGVAAAAGGLLGAIIILPAGGAEAATPRLDWSRATHWYALVMTVVGVLVAVSRVRYL